MLNKVLHSRTAPAGSQSFRRFRFGSGTNLKKPERVFESSHFPVSIPESRVSATKAELCFHVFQWSWLASMSREIYFFSSREGIRDDSRDDYLFQVADNC